MAGNDRAARLILVRHGEIQANLARIWHGSTDSSLTELGRVQARRVAGFLAQTRPRAAALYSSPLARSRQTAEPIAEALGLAPRLEADLAEYGIGELEGVSYADLFGVHGFFDRIRRDPGFAPPGGESVQGVAERVTDALYRIARAHPGAEVIAVSHGAAMGLALARLIEGDLQAWQRYQLSNCGVSELALEPEPRLLSFDETAHLDETRPTPSG